MKWFLSKHESLIRHKIEPHPPPFLGHPGLQLLLVGPDERLLLAQAVGRAAHPPPQDDHWAQVLRQHALQPPHTHTQGGLHRHRQPGRYHGGRVPCPVLYNLRLYIHIYCMKPFLLKQQK